MPDCGATTKRDTVTGMSTKLIERGARIRRTKWVELSCMLCGESVATLEGGTLLRPRSAKSVRVNGAREVEAAAHALEAAASAAEAFWAIGTDGYVPEFAGVGIGAAPDLTAQVDSAADAGRHHHPQHELRATACPAPSFAHRHAQSVAAESAPIQTLPFSTIPTTQVTFHQPSRLRSITKIGALKVARLIGPGGPGRRPSGKKRRPGAAQGTGAPSRRTAA